MHRIEDRRGMFFRVRMSFVRVGRDVIGLNLFMDRTYIIRTSLNLLAVHNRSVLSTSLEVQVRRGNIRYYVDQRSRSV